MLLFWTKNFRIDNKQVFSELTPVLIHKVISLIKKTKTMIGYKSSESEDKLKLVYNKFTRSTSQSKTEKMQIRFFVFSNCCFNRVLWIPNWLKMELIEYLAITNDVLLNWLNHEWEWLIIMASASKILNDSNH